MSLTESFVDATELAIHLLQKVSGDIAEECAGKQLQEGI